MSWYKKAQANNLIDIKSKLEELALVAKTASDQSTDFLMSIPDTHFGHFSELNRNIQKIRYDLALLIGTVNGKIKMDVPQQNIQSPLPIDPGVSAPPIPGAVA